MEVNFPTIIILVGVPGSGKSTWLLHQHELKEFECFSTDDIIEKLAYDYYCTYDEIFKDTITFATHVFFKQIHNAIADNQSFILDRTNTSVKSRKIILDMLPPNYRKIAVFFQTPDQETLNKRLNSRPGKTIPNSVMESMISKLVKPTKEEGFDEIITIV